NNELLRTRNNTQCNRKNSYEMPLSIISCSEKFVVLSDTNAYHIKSGTVFNVECDSTLRTYEQFTLSNEEFKELYQTRFGEFNKSRY
ncbi:MAG: hypothetical protein AAFY41_13655, partial [Bacteroidota bacterium]